MSFDIAEKIIIPTDVNVITADPKKPIKLRVHYAIVPQDEIDEAVETDGDKGFISAVVEKVEGIVKSGVAVDPVEAVQLIANHPLLSTAVMGAYAELRNRNFRGQKSK
ncbi:hypothetical protein [Beggiatoa leptomitoformis]|uniref:Phage tail assembly protein n=1 Tax=Beggiatoa leptomitoformis TaxID=288004 RepID=A0A2N9YH67_9GAMM|nr:hypothetical protein [Beggiatoa leptomitoformis]ALG67871.1 hypothetical protein AL038_09310 [Beggiatoa leptomitoformis]AUI69868.1 hypothetical protein BLE401_14990 [Beggiatoa leptomitoformis]